MLWVVEVCVVLWNERGRFCSVVAFVPFRRENGPFYISTSRGLYCETSLALRQLVYLTKLVLPVSCSGDHSRSSTAAWKSTKLHR